MHGEGVYPTLLFHRTTEPALVPGVIGAGDSSGGIPVTSGLTVVVARGHAVPQQVNEMR